tara:strand:+ start:2666 stop:3736 length:1071 start_codon:yes stop_codon:yes gene_type:complete
MNKIIKLIIYNFLIFITLLLIIELLSGRLLLNKTKLDCSYILCDRKLHFENITFHDSSNKYDVIYTRDKYGLRGMKKSLDEIDILTVGGSTTDERYLKLKDTWSEKLEIKFESTQQNFDVVNAGIDGQSTNGHIWNFENWFNKIENFEPKYIIFYIGINDVLSKNIKSYKKSYNQDISKLNFFNKIKYFLKKNNGISYKSYLLIFKNLFLKDKYNVGHNPLRKNIEFIIPTSKIKVNRLTRDVFLNNLKKLTQYSRDQNSIPIFITQRTYRWHKKNEKIYSISKIDFHDYEKKVSKMIMVFCAENKVFCVDLNNHLDFNEKDTYDLVHTTVAGSEKIAEYIFKEIKNYINPTILRN